MKYWEVGPFDSCVGIMVPDIACAGQMVREVQTCSKWVPVAKADRILPSFHPFVSYFLPYLFPC
jgi:hypothetical protein